MTLNTWHHVGCDEPPAVHLDPELVEDNHHHDPLALGNGNTDHDQDDDACNSDASMEVQWALTTGDHLTVLRFIPFCHHPCAKLHGCHSAIGSSLGPLVGIFQAVTQFLHLHKLVQMLLCLGKTNAVVGNKGNSAVVNTIDNFDAFDGLLWHSVALDHCLHKPQHVSWLHMLTTDGMNTVGSSIGVTAESNNPKTIRQGLFQPKGTMANEV